MARLIISSSSYAASRLFIVALLLVLASIAFCFASFRLATSLEDVEEERDDSVS